MDEHVSLCRLERAHFGLIGEWLAQPHVARWWVDPHTPDAIEAEYGPRVDGDDATATFIIELDGEPVGLIQWYRYRDEPDYLDEVRTAGIDVDDDAVAIDYFIGDLAATGRGVGPAAIDQLVADLWRRHDDAGEVVVAVHADNYPSQRALEKAHFHALADADLEPDNPADDRRHRVFRRARFSPGTRRHGHGEPPAPDVR